MSQTFIGIDIGLAGSIVIQKDDEVICHKMPLIGKNVLDFHALDQILSPYEGFNGMVVFEKLGVIYGSSKATAFSMGLQAGAIEMMCVSRAIRFTPVPAKVWQAEMFQGIQKITKPTKDNKEKADTKAMALLAAKRLFPKIELTFGGRATKPHDGLIDALLMSEYSKRKFSYNV